MHLDGLGCVTGLEQAVGPSQDWQEIARQRAIHRLVEKMRPYITVTNLPRTGDDFKVWVQFRG